MCKNVRENFADSEKMPIFAGDNLKNQLMNNDEKLASLGIERQRLGLELAKWRIRNGITQNELAKRWGMSRYSIIRAEKGKTVGWQFAYGISARLAKELLKEQGL